MIRCGSSTAPSRGGSLPKLGVVRLMPLSAPWKAVQAGGVLGPLGEAEEALDLAREVRHDGACSYRPKDS